MRAWTIHHDDTVVDDFEEEEVENRFPNSQEAVTTCNVWNDGTQLERARPERIYKPGNKKEWRAVYWLLLDEDQENHTNVRKQRRRQCSFSCLKYGEEGARQRARTVLDFISVTGYLPPNLRASPKASNTTSRSIGRSESKPTTEGSLDLFCSPPSSNETMASATADCWSQWATSAPPGYPYLPGSSSWENLSSECEDLPLPVDQRVTYANGSPTN